MPQISFILWFSFLEGFCSLPCVPYVFERWFMYQSAGIFCKRATVPQLWPGLGVVTWCMSRYIHIVNTIFKKYMNLPKEHKIEGLILVGETNCILWRRGGGVYHCILYSVVTSMILSYFSCDSIFMWWRRVLRRFYLVLRKLRILCRIPCNWLMAQSQRI